MNFIKGCQADITAGCCSLFTTMVLSKWCYTNRKPLAFCYFATCVFRVHIYKIAR